MEDLDKTKFDEDMAKAETEEEKKTVTMEFEAQEMKLRKRSLGGPQPPDLLLANTNHKPRCRKY